MVAHTVPPLDEMTERVAPAEIRAMAFAAALGPRTPVGPPATADQVDLAGAEAFLDYLARVVDPPAA